MIKLLHFFNYKNYKIKIYKKYYKYFIIKLLDKNNHCPYHFVTKKLYKSNNNLYSDIEIKEYLKPEINEYPNFLECFKDQIDQLKYFVDTGYYCNGKYCCYKNGVTKLKYKPGQNIMISELLERPGFDLENNLFN